MATSSAIAIFKDTFAADVAAGLTNAQKTLPSKYLYDDVGSRLFEAITVLEEYGPTRAEARLLCRHKEEIVAQLGDDPIVAELGSGSGEKTHTLLRELGRHEHVDFFPIEISPDALRACARELADLKSVTVHGIEGEYLDGLAKVSARRDRRNLAVLFLGSTLGNLDHDAAVDFLQSIRQHLRPGESLLLGVDLVKPVPVLLRAYDDDAGVTAAFNKNMLVRINRELDADFDLSEFAHEARFNPQTSSVEMHLVSQSDQTVRIRGAGNGAGGLRVSFKQGETIWTESSHKYTVDEVKQMAARSGLYLAGQWIDREWGFAELLLKAN